MSEMLDALKRLAEEAQANGEYDVEQVDIPADEAESEGSPESEPPLEQAITKAIDSMNEILYYAQCGSLNGIMMEARDTIQTLKMLKAQYDASRPPIQSMYHDDDN